LTLIKKQRNVYVMFLPNRIYDDTFVFVIVNIFPQ